MRILTVRGNRNGERAMRRLCQVAVVIMALSLYAHAANFPISAGASTATIQSTINSAASASGGNTVTFAAGNYTITSQINIPCPASALTITGPTPTGAPTNLSTGAGGTWPISPTAVISGNLGVNWGFSLSSGGSCSTALTIQYIEWNGGSPSGGGGGFLFVPQNTSNLTLWWNFIHGNGANEFHSHEQDTLVWMDGPQGQSPRDANVTIKWNRFGQLNSNDCAALMNKQGGFTDVTQSGPSCIAQSGSSCSNTSPNGLPGGYVLDGIKPVGVQKNACWYQDCDTEKRVGGYCGAVGIHVNTDNFNFSNNTVTHQEQGLKFFEGTQSAPGIYTPTNLTVKNNDFVQIHRIDLEAQQGSPGPWNISNNSEHDMALFGGVSWGLSLPQGGPNFPASNVMVLNNNNNALDKYGFGTAGAEGIEQWGDGSISSNNLIQGYWSGGVNWGFGKNMQINNTFMQLIGSSGCIQNEENQPTPPSQSGNVCNTPPTPAAKTSIAPSISPSSGAAPLAVTLTDSGYTSGAIPLGNHGIWYTTDGSTPVPGSGTAKYLASGGTFTMPGAGTVKAVGMWGALNQPASYPSGFGFTPSSAVSATFTSSACVNNITTFGAVGNGTTDNTTAINNALSNAATNHCSVLVPAGTFAYSNVLTSNGVAVTGVGSTSILKATNATNSAFKLTGTAPSLQNLVMLGTGSSRNTGPNQSEVWVSGATGYLVNNVLINGGSCTGIWDQGGVNGTETNNTVENTLADSITNTNGANQILIQNNLVINSGDDGISNNSYTTDGNTVNHITVNANSIMRNAFGRGLEVSGGSNISFTNNYVNNAIGLADLILTSETSSFQTQAVNTVTVSGNTLIQGGSNSQGDLFLWPDGSSNALSNLTINNNRFQVNNTFTAVQTTGAGTISSSTLSNSQAYVGPSASFFSGSSTGITQTANSTFTTASYPGPLNPIIGGTVPIFSLPTGSYSLPQSLTLTEVTSGDSIQWCTAGGGTCTPSTTYTGAITISAPQTICSTGTNSSSVTPVVSAAVCATYNGGASSPAATPVFSPASSSFFVSQSVSVSDSTPGSSIFCTTDGTTPSPSSPPYTGAFNVTSTTTIQCMATASGFLNSAVGSGTYTLSVPTLTGCTQDNAGSVNSMAVGGKTQQFARCSYAASGENLICSPTADKYGDVATVWGAGGAAITVGAIGNPAGCTGSLNGPGCVTGISATGGTAVNSTLTVGAHSCSPWGWTITNSPPTLLSATVTLQGGGTAVNVGSTVQACANMLYTGSITTQLCGTGTDSFGTVVSNWTSSSPSNATVVPATGVYTGVFAGTTNAGVTAGSFTPSLAISVNMPITGVNATFSGAQLSGAQIQ